MHIAFLQDNEMALHLASRGGHWETVRVLLKKSVNFHRRGKVSRYIIRKHLHLYIVYLKSTRHDSSPDRERYWSTPNEVLMTHVWVAC